MLANYLIIFANLLLGTVTTQFIGLKKFSDEESLIHLNGKSVPLAGPGKSRLSKQVTTTTPPPEQVTTATPPPDFRGLEGELTKILFPGLKNLDESVTDIWLLLKEEPNIVRKMIPTLKEILEAIRNEKEISDKMVLKWGKTFQKSYGPFLKKWIKALRKVPIDRLLKILNGIELDVDDSVDEVFSWMKEILEITKELITKEEVKSRWSWFKILDMFKNDDKDIGMMIKLEDTNKTKGGWRIVGQWSAKNKSKANSGSDTVEKEESHWFAMSLFQSEQMLGMEKAMPGMKEIWDPLKKTMRNIWPAMKEDVIFIKGQMDTLKDIIAAIDDDKKVNDTMIIKWGRALLQSGGPHFRMWVDALQASPLEELKEKLKLLDTDNIEGVLGKSKLSIVKEILVWFEDMLTLLQDIVEPQEAEETSWFFDKLIDWMTIWKKSDNQTNELKPSLQESKQKQGDRY